MKAAKAEDKQTLARLDKIAEKLDLISDRLDVTISLILDIVLANDQAEEPAPLIQKLNWLDSGRRLKLAPSDLGRILGRKSSDISSRRNDIQKALKDGRKIRTRAKKADPTQELIQALSALLAMSDRAGNGIEEEKTAPAKRQPAKPPEDINVEGEIILVETTAPEISQP